MFEVGTLKALSMVLRPHDTQHIEGLSLTERAVLCALVIYTNVEGECWPSQTTLAKGLNCDIRTVQRTLKSLEKKQLIVRAESPEKSSTLYTVQLVQAEEAPGIMSCAPGTESPPPGIKSGTPRHKVGYPPAQCRVPPGIKSPEEDIEVYIEGVIEENSSEDELRCSRETGSSDEEVEGQSKKRKKKKAKRESVFYTWQNYDFENAEQVWADAKQGKYPAGENHVSMIIGAYLLALKNSQGLDPGIAGEEYKRCIGGASQCFEYFKRKHGDETMSHVLKYIEWFCTQPGDSYIGNVSWNVNALFMTSMYRDFEASGKKKPKKKAGFDENYQHRNNPIGKPILTLEDRVAWLKDENAKYDAKQAAKKAARKAKLNGPPNPDVPSVGTDATSSPEDPDDKKSAT